MQPVEATMEAPSTLKVETLIIGAGFSGICMAIKLKQAGRTSFLIVEKSGDLGGTWAVNKYPGCACDVESHLYSFSFYPNPEWNRLYARASEIQSYLNSCAAHYDLLPAHVRFYTRAAAAVWDKDAAIWRVELVSAGDESKVVCTAHARFVISAVGGLSVPKLPSVPGIQSFRGLSIHSNQWTASVDKLCGKRVAVVGTGASAIQIVPEVGRVADKLYVVQRSPAWILPKLDVTVSRTWKLLFKYIPLVLWLWRIFLFMYREVLLGTTLWGVPLLYRTVARRVGETVAVLHMKAHIKNAELRQRLTPAYEMGCKRVLLSSEFYPALRRDNVEVISGSLVEVRERSIVVKTGQNREVEVDLDVVIYATGFDLFQPKFHVVGSNPDSPPSGTAPRSFLGITKHGFPNFFTMMGPHSYVGHTSVILIMEAQARYILSCMDLLVKQEYYRHCCCLEVKLSSQERFQELLARRFPQTVWRPGGCHSWYFDSKSGENPFIWPASVFEYMFYAFSASADDYDFY